MPKYRGLNIPTTHSAKAAWVAKYVFLTIYRKLQRVYSLPVLVGRPIPPGVRKLPPSVGEVITSNESSALPHIVFHTTPNIFGLVRQYFSSTPPSHDLEEYGVQKSQGDFMKLIEILGDSAFSCGDVRSTQWKKVNSQLGLNEYDKEDGVKWEDEDTGPQVYQATDLYHQSLVSVIREKIANTQDSKHFHYELYKLHWHPPHLDDELWPTYMYFGNESKYRRCKPSCNLSNHVAYFEMLPNSFKDFTGGKGMNPKCATHCHRGLFHEQWKILLDDGFLEAYKHGIIIHCCDGITWRFYPRIFTYSADYPEKVLIATEHIQNMGMPQDRQQRETLVHNDERRLLQVSTVHSLIYEQNLGVGSAAVERILKSQSWVPTLNSFSDHLGPLGFNIFCTLVVDLLHEFELGIWKMLFIHLLRIVMVHDKGLIHELDQRYRQIPIQDETLTRSKCSIPVFDGLLPEPHNRVVLQLLFTMSHWHRLAKLCMHSELTLEIMDKVTSTVGRQFHAFKATVCSSFDTHELHQEVEAHACCATNHTAKQVGAQKGKGHARNLEQQEMLGLQISPDSVWHIKVFNFQTYKFHALGDYMSTIHQYGTTDSYSTEPGELKHRSPKGRYLRSPHVHHHIGSTQKHPVHIGTYLRTHEGDPALKVSLIILTYTCSNNASQDFVPKLKDYLSHRIQKSKGILSLGEDYTTNTIILKDDRMYQHNITRFNYTTYNVRRAQDVLNPQTSHCNIMALSTNNTENRGHRFTYGKVLGIYHVNVIHIGSGMTDYTPQRMEFLWVLSSWESSTLDQVKFLPLNDEHSFDFVDPKDILRGCHIIPWVSACAEDKSDWFEYYVNRFIDHDMLMCFHFGLGVGDVYSHYRSMQAKVQEDNAVQAGHTLHGQYTTNDTIDEDANEDEDTDEDEDADEDALGLIGYKASHHIVCIFADWIHPYFGIQGRSKHRHPNLHLGG
ncbi:hypothetical protein BDR04DRAFT_1129692 [Suillus decipiens]|nr:hypothetical protein BDR04DRAFT_1129692 [Suillus decipiens]